MVSWSLQFAAAECCVRTITRTHYAVDDCGNTSTCIQSITILDTTPPTITCPADETIECGDTLPVSMATAADICDSDPFVTLIREFSTQRADGTCLYRVIRTFQAVDHCGLTTTCTQVITVEDTTPPVVSCPADETIACDELTCLTLMR
jgi:hypothetical protein